jgi:hypothetical protein
MVQGNSTPDFNTHTFRLALIVSRRFATFPPSQKYWSQ